MQNGLQFEEVQFPEVVKKRQQDHADENVLHQLNFGLINQMHLSHHAGDPNAQKSYYLENDHNCTCICTFQFPMPVEQKDSQVGYISGPEDYADAVGGKIGKCQLDKDQRIRNQDQDYVEDKWTLFGLYLDVYNTEEGHISDAQFTDRVEL